MYLFIKRNKFIYYSILVKLLECNINNIKFVIFRMISLHKKELSFEKFNISQCQF